MALLYIAHGADDKGTFNLNFVLSATTDAVINEFHNRLGGDNLGVVKILEKQKKISILLGRLVPNSSKGPVRRSRKELQQYNSGATFGRIMMDVAGPS